MREFSRTRPDKLRRDLIDHFELPGGTATVTITTVGEIIDNVSVIRSVHSDTFNHDPAVMFMNTGRVRFGRPSLGSWLSYGLGSENNDLPAFVVLASGKNRQPL